MHPNTHPEPVIDKNGVVTTRHKKNAEAYLARRPLPMPDSKKKAVTVGERTASATSAQKTAFDAATLIVHSMAPSAKTITLMDVDGRVVLAGVDDSEIDEGRKSFLVSSLLDQAGVSEGVYKLSSAVSSDKVEREILGILRMNKPESTRLNSGGLTDIEGLVVLHVASSTEDEQTLEYMAHDMENGLAQSLAASSPFASAALVDSLAKSVDVGARMVVARRSENPEIVGVLLRDEAESVRSIAAANKHASAEDLVRAYHDSRSETTRYEAVRNANSPETLAIDAYHGDWSHRVIAAADDKIKGMELDEKLWDNKTASSFIKDDQLKSAAKKAAEYTTSVSMRSADGAAEPVVLSDDEARAIAWRVASRMKSPRTRAFREFDSGQSFSLSTLAAEASYIKNQRLEQRSYGLKWDADDYMRAIIGWARTKQATGS